ncbi:MAG: hypothetical protein ACLQU4_05745 [Limisphaerales bacterium]
MNEEPKNNVPLAQGCDNDFELRFHLRDTIILLGGKADIADLLVKSQDGFIREADIDVLRNYNIGPARKNGHR